MLLLAAGCGTSSDGSSDDAATDDDAAATDDIEPSPTSTTTTAAPTTSTTTTSTTSSTTTTTTEPPDTEPPAAPTNVSCIPGAGSGELTVEWDAPAEIDGEIEVAGYWVYVASIGSGLERVERVVLSDAETIDTTSDRWSATVYPIPVSGSIDVAVTALDAADNESGWYPIDAYYLAGTPSCHTGPPTAPTVVGIYRAAGSGEIDVIVSPPAPDVVEYRISADIDGAGMAPLDVTIVGPSSISPPNTRVTATFTNWSVPVVYRVVAIDAHGHVSAPTDRSCPPIPGISDSC